VISGCTIFEDACVLVFMRIKLFVCLWRDALDGWFVIVKCAKLFSACAVHSICACNYMPFVTRQLLELLLYYFCLNYIKKIIFIE
jgi:hypothetical protein